MKIKGFTIRDEIKDLIKEDRPDFNNDSEIEEAHLQDYKLKHAQKLAGWHSDLALDVTKHNVISDDLLLKELTREETFTDKVANFASSHSFAFCLLFFVAIWVALNYRNGFDDYPFNLLDLVLGIIASLQALFIMISQNKSDKIDKKRSEATYRISLKNELELNILREKLDHVKDVQNVYLYEELKLLNTDRVSGKLHPATSNIEN